MPSFMRQIRVIGRCSNIYHTAALEGTGLSGGHTAYLFTLCRTPGMSQEQLSRHIYVNKSNVTRHLAQLEKLGYVERRQSMEDKRVILVYPTQKAYDILPRVTDVIKGWNSYLTEEFTEEEMEQFNAMLARITERATAAVNRQIDKSWESDDR